jgi:hypothetical protein
MTFKNNTLLTLFVLVGRYHLKDTDAGSYWQLTQLDTLMLQLYTLSFFLSPSLLPLLCRLACQFTSYKPREVDPKLSLRVWFFLLCASNVPSFWSHARDGATEARAVILDFVGMGK